MMRTIEQGPVAVIVNPGSRSGQELEDDTIREAFAARGREAQVHRLEGGAFAETVRRACEGGARVIVAAGGDGTVNAVAAEVLQQEDAVLAVLPVGTLNHFARDLGMPLELDAAVAVIAAGHVREVDVGEVNGRIFLNNSSLGLYASLVVERERLQEETRLGKWSAMVRAGWSVLRHQHTFSVVLCIDGRDLSRRTPFVFIGNNDYVIEGLKAGERARLDEGVLSIYVLRSCSAWGLLMLALRALAGRIVHGRDLEELHASSLRVESRHGQLEVARDGEVGELDAPLHYRILGNALRVIAPSQEAIAR